MRDQTGSSLALGYTGQLTDPSTGFIDLRARQLDPTLGRFLSADSVQPNAPGTQGYNLYAYTANNPTTWVDLSGHAIGDPTAAASGTAMVGIFAMLLTSAVAGACIATAGWCLPFLVLGLGLSSTTGLLVATAVIVITFALIACALDAACQALTHRIGATVAKYGSAAVAGAWTAGVTATRDAIQTFPDLPTVLQPSPEPHQQQREAPVPPQSDDGDNDRCQAAKKAAEFDVSTFGFSQDLETHLEQHKPSSRVDGNGHFSQAAWSIKTDIIRTVLKLGHAHLNPSTRGRADCEVTLQFPHTVGTDGKGNTTQTVAVYIDYDGRVRSAYPIPDLALRP